MDRRANGRQYHWPARNRGSCFAWGLDNNLTRNVSLADPLQIVELKGLLADPFNVVLGLSIGAAGSVGASGRNSLRIIGRRAGAADLAGTARSAAVAAPAGDLARKM
jgi:hypothetical protein